MASRLSSRPGDRSSPVILLLLVSISAQLSTSYAQSVAAAPTVPIPVRPALPNVERVLLNPTSNRATISVEAANIDFTLDAVNRLSFTAPRYITSGKSTGIQAPAIITNTTCSNFVIDFTNALPYMPHHTCPANPPKNFVYAPTLLEYLGNGFEDFTWTNLHTHGLHMHPGATSLLNQCDNAATGGLTGVKPSTWTAYDFYCNAGMDATQLCDVYADNVFADARPRFSQSTRPGTTIRYTYPLDAHVPGVHLYHPHHHGSISSQMPTAAGPIIVPEASLPGGLAGLHTSAAATTAAECNRLQAVLDRQKVEDSTLIQFSALWFRNNGAAPEDDSLPFLGLNGNQINPLLFDANGRPLFTNLAGRDWALANGAFQPSIPLTAQRYSRWNLINAFTMRWLDLSIQQVDATGQLSIVPGCSFRLMGRDGVPLPTTPRLIQSKGLNGQTVSNLILNTANRVDVLVKCDAPGTYLLVSGGAGPFKTNPAACKTTHCELFGDTPVTGATVLPGNNLYNGFELSGAVMAVLNVAPLPADGSLAAEADFANGVCRSMLEKWYYTDFSNFPPGATKQCFSFMNANFGGMCAINNQPLLVTPVEQGTTQEWEVRDTTYHPFHLHMAPVRMAKLPRCATDVTNMWATGDWNDVVSLPVCQWGCPWTATGSGLGAPGNRVSVCDAVTLQWRAPDFSRPTPLGAPDLCNGVSASMAEPASCTASKWSMFHCHAIPHEDEGCLAVLEMTCPGSKPKTASCPNTY